MDGFFMLAVLTSPKQYLIKRIFMSINWSSLAAIGNSGFIRSFNIWFVVIPIFAKVLENFGGTIAIEFFNPPLPLCLSLPFSLKVLYGSTILFTTANILYMTSCPRIIKNYKSYSEFLDKEGKSIEMLKQLLLPQVWNGKEIIDFPLLDKFSKHMESSFRKDIFDEGGKTFDELYSYIKPGENLLPDAYAIIKAAYEQYKTSIRLLITALYLFGFLGLLYLLAQNVDYVFKLNLMEHYFGLQQTCSS
jgi:hypothetical protein